MSQHKKQNPPHHGKMPDARIVKASHHPGEPRKLNRLPYAQSGEYREHAQTNRAGISLLLQRVVGFAHRRPWSEKEIMLHHRPHAGEITMREQNLAVIPAENLVTEI